MADWAEILGEGLVGGVLGFADSRYQALENEEEMARKEGLERLRNELNIDEIEMRDRLYNERIDKQDRLNRERDVEDAQRRRQGLLEDRAYQEGRPTAFDREYESRKNKLGEEAAREWAMGSRKEKPQKGMTREDIFDIESKVNDAYNKYSDSYDEKYNFWDEEIDGEKPPKLDREQFTKQNFGSIYPVLYKKSPLEGLDTMKSHSSGLLSSPPAQQPQDAFSLMLDSFKNAKSDQDRQVILNTAAKKLSGEDRKRFKEQAAGIYKNISG